jgi:rare lipoprotein A
LLVRVRFAAPLLVYQTGAPLGRSGPPHLDLARMGPAGGRGAPAAPGPATVAVASAGPAVAAATAPIGRARFIAAPRLAPEAEGRSRLNVQAGAFADPANARRAAALLAPAGAARIEAVTGPRGALYLVFVGHPREPAEARALRARVAEIGFTDAVVRF